MKHSRSAKTPAQLPESTLRRLNTYALAASAAGVGVLALVRPSEAKIVYTPANITIPSFTHFPLDLNHDGVNDMSFYWGSSGRGEAIWVSALQSNGVVGYQAHRGVVAASALKAGAHVGPRKNFEQGKFIELWKVLVTSVSSHSTGQWKNVRNRYLGVKFSINGKTHYGWVRLSVDIPNRGIHAVITGYAFETIPNKQIVAGKTKGPDEMRMQEPNATLDIPAPTPASLGLLAMGAPGLSIWRRESVGATL
jgi:hypothetical protein